MDLFSLEKTSLIILNLNFISGCFWVSFLLLTAAFQMTSLMTCLLIGLGVRAFHSRAREIKIKSHIQAKIVIRPRCLS
jgi:hypothetical protein